LEDSCTYTPVGNSSKKICDNILPFDETRTPSERLTYARDFVRI